MNLADKSIETVYDGKGAWYVADEKMMAKESCW